MSERIFLYEEDTIPEAYSAKDEIHDLRCLTPEEIQESTNGYPIRVCYSLMDLGNNDDGLTPTRYHFFQSEFSTKEIQSYFKIMRNFTKYTLSTLLEHATEYHLHPNHKLSQELKNAFDTRFNPQKKSNVRDQYPMIYHFALYQEKNTWADEATGQKSPRIFFILGAGGIIYPIFFDPYHKLNPMDPN